MRFLIDAMLPPSTRRLLIDRAHEAITPTDLGAHNLSDDAPLPAMDRDAAEAIGRVLG